MFNKFRKPARLLILILPLLTGCGHFWDPPSSGSGIGSGPYYVLNQRTPQIAAFSIPAGAKAPVTISGSPYSLGTALPTCLAVSPKGFLYVGTTFGIYAYKIQKGGALTILNNGEAISADIATSIGVDPSGHWLLDAINGGVVSESAVLNALPLDSMSGLPPSGSTEVTALLPSTEARQLTVSPLGSRDPYVFVAMGSEGVAAISFAALKSNPFDGVPKLISPKNTGGVDTSVAVDLTHPVLYVGETELISNSNSGGLRVFTIGANSSIDEVANSPYATGGVEPSFILPTSNYVYVANKTVSGRDNGNISAFAITITGTAFSLTPIVNGSIGAGFSTVGLSEDRTATYVLAVNSGGSPDLNAYTIDSKGALAAYGKASTGSDPTKAEAIVAAP